MCSEQEAAFQVSQYQRDRFRRYGSCCDVDNCGGGLYRIYLYLRRQKPENEHLDWDEHPLCYDHFEHYFELTFLGGPPPDEIRSKFQRFPNADGVLPAGVGDVDQRSSPVWMFTAGFPLDETQKARRTSMFVSEWAKKDLNFFPSGSGQEVPISKALQLVKEKMKDGRVCFYAGAGISVEFLAYGGQLAKLSGHQRSVALDDLAFHVLTEEGRYSVSKVYYDFLFNPASDIKNKEGSRGHKIISNLCNNYSQSFTVTTTNSDPFFADCGIIPQVITDLVKKKCEGMAVLVCVGVGADQCGLVESFRKNVPGGLVVVFNLQNQLPYLQKEDLVVKKDLQLSVLEFYNFFSETHEVSSA